MNTSTSCVCVVGRIFFIAVFVFSRLAEAQTAHVAFQKSSGNFVLASAGKAATLYAGSEDFPGVIRAIKNLKTDIGSVTGVQPELKIVATPAEKEIVIAGTIGKSTLIDQLIQNKKLDASSISRKWETFLIQVVDQPFPGVERALIVAGSDKRGTIYGIYDLSRQIGVSPWHWWADVPARQNKNLYVTAGKYFSSEPAVKYRGIFINDEEPSLGRFVVEKYGGFTHEFYEKVFELLLRLKGNYLWPAMWWASFNSDDPLNPALADEYGIVMGTSHHEPMMRAHAEWKKINGGEWNYESNAVTLQKFWTDGITRMGDRESIVTLAMRGDGDMAMSPETNIALLEKIVKDQRAIIHDVTGKDISTVPQLWALYKEVQAYYDRGMRVPDDVTLLLCDDNWGNIRKLPKPGDKPRNGGYGIYYHLDYVGDPRNYKWLNTNPIIKVWEQMHLAHSYGVDKIWIVNVGDLKPMEFPISFFLDYAWDPKKWNQDNLTDYTTQWCQQQFGNEYASEIAEIISGYTKFNGRRKPELLTPETYSLVNYHEAENIVREYRTLEALAEKLYAKIEPSSKDAFYQLVLFPVKACANLNDLYVTTGKNKLYARQGRAMTNELAAQAKTFFEKDIELSTYYNKTLSGGKWSNLMNQIHIGYTYWQDPKEAVMPETATIEVPLSAEMGIAVEGAEKFWLTSSPEAIMPGFYANQNTAHYFEIFNRGKTSFPFSITADPWIKLSATKGTIEKEQRITARIDWAKIPTGTSRGLIRVKALGKEVTVMVMANDATKSLQGCFIETDHVIAIEPEHYDRAVGRADVTWQVLKDYGRTLSGITPFPVTSKSQALDTGSPHLEYNLYLLDTTAVTVQLLLGTTLSFNANQGLQLAVSIDDEIPRVINIHNGETPQTWGKTVEDNMRLITSRHKVSSSGRHVLKYWMVDPGIVLQKIIVDAGGLRPSYLGPPENPRISR